MAPDPGRSAAARKAAATRRRNKALEATAGHTLQPAMVSPVVQGHVRLWFGDDTFVYRLDDAEGASALLGRGLVARTGVEPRRFREVGMFDRETGILLVPGRLRSASASPAAPSDLLVNARPFTLAEASEPAPSGDAWRDFCHWLTPVFPAAAARGEFVLLERGGWEHAPYPFVLAICRPGENGWTSQIDAEPPPPPGGAWPERSGPPEKGATARAPASGATLRTAAVLMVDAAANWARSPLDLAITFGVSPFGPYAPVARGG